MGVDDNRDTYAAQRIDKGIVHVDVSGGTEMPNGIHTPMTPLRAVPTNHMGGPNVSSFQPDRSRRT